MIKTSTSLPKLELSNKPTVIITQKLRNQIEWLHKKCGSTEWSGELITSEEGRISDLDDWKIKCEEIYLTDIGSPGFTGYEVDKGGFKAVDIVELYESYPELLEGKKRSQHIHTHHNMAAFFSGTDWEQLHDRASISNYLLMLIVNFSGNYVAKVAFKAKKSNKSVSIDFANNEDKYPSLTMESDSPSEVLVVMDCNIVHEPKSKMKFPQSVKEFMKKASEMEEVDDDFMKEFSKVMSFKNLPVVDDSFEKRYTYVQTEKEKESKPYTYYGTPYGSYKGTPGFKNYDKGKTTIVQDTFRDFSKSSKSKKNKRISDMTDDEFNKWFEDQNEYNDDIKSKFGREEAFVIMNYFLDDSLKSDKVLSPLAKINEINTKIGGKKELVKEFLVQFMVGFKPLFNKHYPNGTDQDYLDLLHDFSTYLDLFEYNNPLIKNLNDSVQDLIKDEFETA